MPGFGITGFRRRNVGIHRVEASPPGREIIDSQDQVVGEAYRPVMIKEQAADGQLSYAGADPEVPLQYPGAYCIDQPGSWIFMPGDGREADTFTYRNLEGETRDSGFKHEAIIPVQQGQQDSIHGLRQDVDLVDRAWPYRLIAGVDYSGPAHPQHSNVWPFPNDFGPGIGNYDQTLTQTPLYPVDLAVALPADHAVVGDFYGIIGPNEHA